MLGILATINQFLGYFNVNSKFKNRLITIIGFIANFYFLYAGISAIRYGSARGWLFLLIFLVLLYFSVLNIIYFFTNKTAKFDISPKIEKAMGGPQKVQDPNATTKVFHGQSTVMPVNGLFDQQQIMPTELSYSPQEQANLNQLVDELIKSGYLSLNYGGLDDDALYTQAQKTHQPFYALGSAVQLPYYELKNDDIQPTIYAGKNAMEVKPIAHIAKIGLSDSQTTLKQYDIALAVVYIVGGPYKIAGRSGLVEGQEPYSAVARVAYKDKEKAPEQTLKSDPRRSRLNRK